MVANGRVPVEDLASVEGLRLETRTAAAYLALQREADDAGIALWIARPAGAYRSLATQRDMHEHPSRYGISPGVTLRPVGQSTHGFGTAVDIGGMPKSTWLEQFGEAGRKRRTWILANASRFGFSRSLGESDHNHLQHNGTTTAGNSGTPISEEQTMPQLIKQTVKNVATYYRVDIDDVVLEVSKDEAAAYNKVNGFDEAIEVSNAGLAGFRRQAAAVAAARTKSIVAALSGGIPVTVPPATIDSAAVAAIAAATSARFPAVPSTSAIATAAADESDRRERERLGH